MLRPMPQATARNVRQRLPGIVGLGLLLAGLATLAGWVIFANHRNARAADIAARIERARDALKKGDPGAASAVVATIPESGPWASDVLTIKGLALAASNQPEESRPLLERSLEIDAKQPMAAKVLAAIYLSEDDTDRALAMLARSATLDPSDFRPWYAAGMVFLRQENRSREAVEMFRRALQLNPVETESRVGLASALLALGEVDEASPLVDALLRERPDDPRVLCAAATRAKLRSQPDEVERYVDRALSRDPDDVNALLLRARTLLESKRANDSLRDLERAVELAPTNLSALHLLARAETAVGLTERAATTNSRHREVLALNNRITRLREEVRERPKDLKALWQLGEAASRGGRTSLARQSFRAALAVDPNCKPAREGLAALSNPTRKP